MPYALETHQLAKNFSGEKALREISFKVPDPCLFGIIGADGAGKSTLMNILSTLIDPDSGQGKLFGLDLATRFDSIRSQIGYMPQRFSLYQDLSVEENLNFFADIFGIKGQEKSERMNQLLDFANLTSFKKRRAGLLSGGMKQKLALACTLIHEPKLLLLDEPTVGVDPMARHDFWTLLKTLRQRGKSLLVSTPYMDEASLCDQLILLHKGTILAEGKPSELLKNYPFQLFRIKATESTLTYSSDKPVPNGFSLIYPSGGDLHAAIPLPENRFPSSENFELLSRIKEVLPEAISIESIQPQLEDLFFALLHSQALKSSEKF